MIHDSSPPSASLFFARRLASCVIACPMRPAASDTPSAPKAIGVGSRAGVGSVVGAGSSSPAILASITSRRAESFVMTALMRTIELEQLDERRVGFLVYVVTCGILAHSGS